MELLFCSPTFAAAAFPLAFHIEGIELTELEVVIIHTGVLLRESNLFKVLKLNFCFVEKAFYT